MFFAGKPEKTGHFYLFAAACVFFLRRFFRVHDFRAAL